MTVIGLDPGTRDSAFVVFLENTVMRSDVAPNDTVLEFLMSWVSSHRTVLVIEQIESFGMAVGREVFETVFWTGRFAQAWSPRPVDRLPRRVIKQHLCHTSRATDGNIRQAIMDRFGGSACFGTKKQPGPLYGITGHKMAALAVALTWVDQNGHKPEEVRPNVEPMF